LSLVHRTEIARKKTENGKSYWSNIGHFVIGQFLADADIGEGGEHQK
jgi:hypothetical protein